MKIDYEDIGSRVRMHRLNSGLSQERLAEIADMSNVHISYIERGERAPSLEAVIGICNALAISSNELLAGNLVISDTSRDASMLAVLFDCTPEESAILLSVAVALKNILRDHTITKK